MSAEPLGYRSVAIVHGRRGPKNPGELDVLQAAILVNRGNPVGCIDIRDVVPVVYSPIASRQPNTAENVREWRRRLVQASCRLWRIIAECLRPRAERGELPEQRYAVDDDDIRDVAKCYGEINDFGPALINYLGLRLGAPVHPLTDFLVNPLTVSQDLRETAFLCAARLEVLAATVQADHAEPFAGGEWTLTEAAGIYAKQAELKPATAKTRLDRACKRGEIRHCGTGSEKRLCRESVAYFMLRQIEPDAGTAAE